MLERKMSKLDHPSSGASFGPGRRRVSGLSPARGIALMAR